MKVRLTNIEIICDVELLDGPLMPTTPIPPVVVVPPVVAPDSPAPVTLALPPGFDRLTSVGFGMLITAMDRAGLTPIGVQGKGPAIIAGLKALYPDLDVYLSPSDAPVWPGHGSIDVTIDSGKGGWSFRVDHVTAWKPAGQR